ncbi:hypothetical protein DWB90_02570 [Staphylococcus chromogenes]|nr:hypothetical protein DWB90_02570 [Staphylococcus chromogenes]
MAYETLTMIRIHFLPLNIILNTTRLNPNESKKKMIATMVCIKIMKSILKDQYIREYCKQFDFLISIDFLLYNTLYFIMKPMTMLDDQA